MNRLGATVLPRPLLGRFGAGQIAVGKAVKDK